jgi:hypothetical protein
MAKKWSEQEDQIIRDTWASNKLMKECLAQLPDRTERAVMVRVQALKLGPRPHMNRRSKSIILAIVLREMERGYVMSSRDVSNRYNCTIKHAADLLAEARAAKKVHIHAWRRTRPGGCYIAVYGFGNVEDAMRPGSKSKQEYNRTRYVNKRMKEGKLIGNVFAVAMAQVMDLELPKPSGRANRGRYERRVYVQEAA